MRSSKLIRWMWKFPLPAIIVTVVCTLFFFHSPSPTHTKCRRGGFLPHKRQGSTPFDKLLVAQDELAVDYLRERVLLPPSSLLYNLSFFDPEGLRAGPLKGFDAWFGKADLDPDAKGFFLEAGANNGEFLSNTLQLETKGWEGLLVEASPTQFEALKTRQRKAWIANVCLSERIRMMTFVSHKRTGEWWSKAVGKPVEDQIPEDFEVEGQVECFPLVYLLRALNRTTIDFFSLDVEGFELEILESFPFEEIEVRTMVVEHYRSPGGKKVLVQLLEDAGFTLVGGNDQDVFLVNKKKKFSQ